jgi:hypothetical protein
MAQSLGDFVNAVSRTGQKLDTAIINANSNSGAAGVEGLFPNTIPNPLKQFASYTYLWDLGVATQEQFNSGSYRNDDGIDYIVLGEGGSNGSKRVSTFYGTPEYFINNIEIKQIEGTPAQPVVNMKFDIFEPYSMALFIQSLQVAAVKAGYVTYTNQAPFILRLRFVGWDENGGQITSGSGLSRYFPFTFKSIGVTHNETGTIYTCQAAPYAMNAFTNVTNSIKKSVSVSGKTVEEVLGGDSPKEKSLATAINNEQLRMKNETTIGEADEYKILFQDENGKPFDKIASASFNFDINSAGAMPTPEDKEAYQKTSAVARTAVNSGDLKSREFSFDPGANNKSDVPRSITSIITEVVTNSDYCTKAYLPENIDADGFINWFRIVTNVKFIEGKVDAKRNQLAQSYEFIVIPYRVHSSKIKSPLSPTIGVDSLKNNVKKVYNYSYTGLNDDVIKFDLQLNTLYYKAVFAGLPEKTSGSEAGQGGAVPKETVMRAGAGTATDQASQPTGTYRQLVDTEAYDRPAGGAAADSPEVIVARNVQKALMETTDMIICNIDIYGDPYWLSDNQLGNYTSPNNGGITEDNYAPYSGGEVRLYLRFKTPIDAPAAGALYDFPGAGVSDNPFSGLYRVTIVVNKFSDGIFSQNLKLLRDRDQQTDDIKKSITDPDLGFFKPVGETDASKSADASAPDASGSQ